MTYVFVHRSAASCMLVEMSRRELRTVPIAERYPDYVPTTPDRARAWVASGGIHETPLYVDYDGKVRYARDGA